MKNETCADTWQRQDLTQRPSSEGSGAGTKIVSRLPDNLTYGAFSQNIRKNL
jgi:hypothetical protein